MAFISLNLTEVFFLDFSYVFLTDVVDKVTLKYIFIFGLLSDVWKGGECLLMSCFSCMINLNIKTRHLQTSLIIKQGENMWPL